MRFDLNLRSVVRQQLRDVASEMQAWQGQNQIDETEVDRIRQSICCFAHTTSRFDLKEAVRNASTDMAGFERELQVMAKGQTIVSASYKDVSLPVQVPEFYVLNTEVNYYGRCYWTSL